MQGADAEAVITVTQAISAMAGTALGTAGLTVVASKVFSRNGKAPNGDHTAQALDRMAEKLSTLVEAQKEGNTYLKLLVDREIRSG